MIKSFASYSFEPESGAYHVRHRVYQPDVAWLQRDPLKYLDGPNFYWYANGNPASPVDPAGTATCGECIGECLARCLAGPSACPTICRTRCIWPCLWAPWEPKCSPGSRRSHFFTALCTFPDTLECRCLTFPLVRECYGTCTYYVVQTCRWRPWDGYDYRDPSYSEMWFDGGVNCVTPCIRNTFN